MAEVILMPRLSDTMTEGVIAAWHKKVGDTVKKGDLLAEIETDKATMELESYKDGTLLHIGGEKGSKIQVDQLLAIVGNPGEDVSGLLGGAKSAANTPLPETSNPLPAVDVSKMSASSSDRDEVVLMPRLSDTMEAGVIANWNKKVGDPVKKGEILAEIETDKATMELESYKNGTLLYVGAPKGEKILVNDLLCIIGDKDKVDVDAVVAAIKSGSGSPLTATGNKQAGTNTQQPALPSVATSDGRVKVSPLAKKLAAEKGIDLRSITGTGDGGRITKADIDNYKEKKGGVSLESVAGSSKLESAAEPVQAEKTAATYIAPVVMGQEGYTDLPNSQMRGIIAKRLAESKFSAPHFYLKIEINMDGAIEARVKLNVLSPVKISFNDMVVKAAAMALRRHPAVNASWLGDKIRRYSHVHVGVAVAIEDGLIVPVIRFADQKTLPQIAAETKELAGKAKNKKLQPSEFTGNTFTISNLGMMDIDEFTAIINPPDSCIMAVGRIKEVVVRKADSFAVSNVMKVTLSCDHRCVDGATGAAFLQTFKQFLENPVTMLL
ncbi:MAG: pyruvate dehydrogenase complex dihydrolipoamide acetyltransferase [Chitinophagaceae bacterium]|nr:pyruvate dehydrogenase complex dihydrolipoamide acetyltransferase [Chitinophagaceae bacterium]